MTTDLLLHEHGRPLVARLTDQEATALQECGAGIDVGLTRTAGLFELRASHYVGTVVLPGLTLMRYGLASSTSPASNSSAEAPCRR